MLDVDSATVDAHTQHVHSTYAPKRSKGGVGGRDTHRGTETCTEGQRHTQRDRDRCRKRH